MRTTAIVNQKGGCGKTTTAINLAAVYARRGFRTLLVDLDPQAHCAAGLGVPEARVEYSIAEAMLDEMTRGFDRARLVWEVARNLDLAPSTMRLAAVEAPGGGLHEKPDRDRRLERVLLHLAPHYDRCLIDCPPTIGLLTFNALRAAREALIPVETSYFAFRGAEKQWETIQRVIQRTGRPIACHLLPTMHETGSELSADILDALRRQFPVQILPVVIRSHEELREAASLGQGVIEYAPESEARRDYEQLADWLVEHDGTPGVEIQIVSSEPSVAAALRPGPVAAVPASSGASAPAPRPVSGVGATGGGGRGDPSRAQELVDRLRRITAGGAEVETEPDRPEAAPTEPLELDLQIEPRPAPAAIPDGDGHEAPRQTDAGAEPGRRDRFGARATSEGMLFVQPGDGSSSIFVAGEFNNWMPSVTPLRHNPDLGVHEAMVRLDPGRHQYRLVIDGRWQADPYNDHQVINDHGEPNSLAIVSPPDTVSMKQEAT